MLSLEISGRCPQMSSAVMAGRAQLQNLLDSLSKTLGNLGQDVFSFVPLVSVILVLVVAGRLLNIQASRASGVRFRNQLIMVGLSFLGVLVVIVVLPVEAGVRSQLLTLVGIITSVTISLSSSTFLGNAMAGIMLKSVRNFRSGDFVQVGDHFGRVTERGLFHTEIQTATRDLTTLPNLFLATTPVRVVRSSGTIVDATVSLGFNIPHARIETVLLAAAEQIELKEPFVQVLDLGDFSVNYRVAGLLEDTKRLLTFRSRLRVAMLDALHQAGIEIVSPNFMNVRDYDPRHEFRPTAASAPSPAAADAPVEVVFDKAEEAATLATLRHALSDQQTQADELEKSLKECKTDQERDTRRAEVARARRQIEKLKADVAAAEEKEKADDD